MTRKEAKASTREKVLGVARELFGAQAYDAVTLRDVAIAAGLSTGSIFNSFSGKEELYEAAMGYPAPSTANLAAFLGEADDYFPLALRTRARRFRRALLGMPT